MTMYCTFFNLCIYVLFYINIVSSTIDLRLSNDGILLYIFENVSYNWNDANERCEYFNGSMIIITNQTETKIFTSMMKNKAWIGVKETQAKQKIYKYIDKTLIHYSNWGQNEPNNNKDYQNEGSCIIIDTNSKWYNELCSARKNLLCQIKVINQNIETFKQNIGTDITSDARMVLFWLEQGENIITINSKWGKIEQEMKDINQTLYQHVFNEMMHQQFTTETSDGKLTFNNNTVNTNYNQSHKSHFNFILYIFLTILIIMGIVFLIEILKKRFFYPRRHGIPTVSLSSFNTEVE